MEHLNKRKPNLLFSWFLLPFVLYGGYAVGRLKELKERVGVTDEEFSADLNDVDGREVLTEQHLERLKETTANMDVAVRDSTV